MQVCPPLRNLLSIAPCIAASRSASAQMMKGALPPSSKESFLTVEAQSAISCLPMEVEPVKLSILTIGLCVRTLPMDGV